MGNLLKFCADEEAPWWHGALWALALVVSETIRVLLFGASWGISYRYAIQIISTQSSSSTGIAFSFNFRTGIRLRSGVMTMVFKKVMRLSSLGDKSIGQVKITKNHNRWQVTHCCLSNTCIGNQLVRQR